MAILLRDGKVWKSKPYLALACISVAALFIGYAPDALKPPEPIYGAARFLDIPHLIFVWLFALSLYDANFRLKLLHVIVGIFYCAPIVWLRLHDYGLLPMLPRWMFIYGSITSLALMVHLCYATFSGRADDLLEARRKSRIYFIVIIIFVTVTAAVIDLLPRDNGVLDNRTAKILSIWPAIVWCAVWLLAFNQRTAHFGSHAGSGRILENRDDALKEKLEALMKNDETYREAGLTISSLAGQLGVNQHSLRTLINQGLGYSNFSGFLNARRINAVKQALEDPELNHLPILTIAMDCGFKSLSTFNKAFKSLEGVTPSAYRKGFKT